MTNRFWGFVFIVMLGVIATGVSASGCATATPPAPPAPAPEPPVSQVAAGVGLKTIVGAAFAPKNITVPVGSTVTWTVASDEPHQVTFFAEGAARPEGSARQWTATVQPGSNTPVDGKTLLHTGVMSKGATISYTFPAVGTFKYFCPIHLEMDGTVQVVPAGQPYTTAAQAEATAKQESDALLALVEPTRRAAAARATRSPLRDGSTMWIVPIGPKVPAATGYLELKEYIPAELRIKKGDTVRWVFETSHSVTLLPPGGQLPDPRPPATKPSEEYDGKSLYTSAVPPRPLDGSIPTWELKFPNAGTFKYICQLHHERLGHIGAVIVD